MTSAMISVSDKIKLQPIQVEYADLLYDLMGRIYIPVYERLWTDAGQWYLDRVFSRGQLQKELDDPKGNYYFVLVDSNIQGILRVLQDTALPKTNENTATKLQRIYLDASVQGMGIGQELVRWVEINFCPEGGTLWLEAMDSEERALRFYKKLGFQIVASKVLRFELMHEALRGMYVMAKTVKFSRP